jgi:hypothetical protein
MATKSPRRPRKERFALCRHDVADLGQPRNYCAKPIKRPNDMNWCEECLKRLPFWP